MVKGEMYLLGETGNEKEVILQFWDAVNERWQSFIAKRTNPGQYITSKGKTGTFREKPLNESEKKTVQNAAALERAKEVAEKAEKERKANAEIVNHTPAPEDEGTDDNKIIIRGEYRWKNTAAARTAQPVLSDMIARGYLTKDEAYKYLSEISPAPAPKAKKEKGNCWSNF